MNVEALLDFQGTASLILQDPKRRTSQLKGLQSHYFLCLQTTAIFIIKPVFLFIVTMRTQCAFHC